MLSHISLHRLLFFDIETASEAYSYNALEEPKQALWGRKHQFIRHEEEATPIHSYERNAAIYAEFGKVICISCGFMKDQQLELYSFHNTSEKELLQAFASFLKAHPLLLCGHNIKEFDIPYICRRMLINAVTLPKVLNIAGKKPWEVNFVDTLQLWKFGDYKSYTSLHLLANLFQIPTPKEDIDGSEVGQVYWQEKNLDRIVQYCQKDVVTVVRLIQKWQQVELISDDSILVKKAM